MQTTVALYVALIAFCLAGAESTVTIDLPVADFLGSQLAKYDGPPLTEKEIPQVAAKLQTDTSYALVLTKLALIKTGKAAVPELRRAYDSTRLETRFAVLEILGRIGPEAKDAIPDLLQALKDPSSDIRYKVKDALARIGKPAIAVLLQGAREEMDAKDEPPFVQILGNMKGDAEEVVPELSTLLREAGNVTDDLEKHNFRRDILEALRQIGTAAPHVAPQLQKGLESRQFATRYTCAVALAHMHLNLDAAFDVIFTTLRDQDHSYNPSPGNMVIWRGFSRLTDIHLGFTLGARIVGN